MSDTDSIIILELLASKICHDLISPVGAIANGVEILEELGGSSDNDDVIALISSSAAQANAKLKMMRMAYGIGGSDSSIKAEEVHKIFGEFLEGENRLSQNWNPYADLGIEPKDGFAKMLISCLLLLIDALPRGGVLSVESDAKGVMLLTAEGENARFRDGYIPALKHTITTTKLDPKLIHAYITGLLAQKYGFEITIEESVNNFIFLRIKSTTVSS